MNMIIAIGVTVASVLFLVAILIRTIQNESRGRTKIWKNFSLSLSLLILFLTTWFAHGLSEWERFKQEQHEHNQPVEFSDFLPEFTAATLENWQSEFLQLFSFVVLAALYIHKGSAESKDSDEEIQAALARIEKKLGT